MSEQSHIKLSNRDGTPWIQLDNPEKHNALTAEDIAYFVTLLDEVESNPDNRVLVITGSGQKTFCSGASLSNLADGKVTGDKFSPLTARVAAMKIPTICAINGSVYGGGVELGLCCDFRIGVKKMRMFVPPARFGLCYPAAGIQRYVTRLGPTTTKRILVTSEEFNSKQLLQIGYLTHRVKTEKLETFVQRLAERIAALAPLAVRAMKQIADQAAANELDLSAADLLVRQCRESEDYREGMQAIMEKRPANFSGR